MFQCEDQHKTSESDVYRRQIVTSKVDPCTERVNYLVHGIMFQCEDQHKTSESDVYRRQILTSKDNPCTERVNYL